LLFESLHGHCLLMVVIDFDYCHFSIADFQICRSKLLDDAGGEKVVRSILVEMFSNSVIL
jgi:hypothetical protein